MTIFFTQSPASLGSWTYTGMRVGPSDGPAGGRRGQLLQYGSGFPYAPVFSYSFVPAALVPGNITGTSATAVSATPGWVPLVTAPVAGDSVVTPYYGNVWTPSSARTNGTSPSQRQNSQTLALQFQSPCRIQMESSASPNSVKFTVFGYDWYGQPVQALLNAEAGGSPTSSPTFYGITGIWCWGGEDAAGTTVQFSTTQYYGLPYKLENVCDLIRFGAGDVTDAAMVNPLNNVAEAGGAGGQITGVTDVRGVILPQEDFEPDNVKKITLTYFVKGANSAWESVESAISGGKNPSGMAWSHTVRPPNLNNLFGFSPFYVGYPV